MSTTHTDHANGMRAEPSVELIVRPERRLAHREGVARHIDFLVRIAATAPDAPTDRLPLSLALVLDRSGSMSGTKLGTAKAAALAVLDRLSERDTAAVVIFDDAIDTLQDATPMTAAAKARVREALSAINARGSTALHEGWLTGCQAITRDDVLTGDRLARCFLLTDGLANVGQCDPELIAVDARGIRERTGITTSTFGIGVDYSEELLGPMAEGAAGSFITCARPKRSRRRSSPSWASCWWSRWHRRGWSWRCARASRSTLSAPSRPTPSSRHAGG